MGEGARKIASLFIVLGCGCTFGASGSGSDDSGSGSADEGSGTVSAGPASSPTASSSAVDASASAASGEGTSGPPPVDTTAGDDDPPPESTTTTGEPTSTDATTGMEGCTAAGEELIAFAADAEVVAPMALAESSLLPGTPQVARSEVAEQGTVTFTFDVACPGEFRIWGLVWDNSPGADNGPDSYYATLDGEPADEYDWYYGCQTGGNPGAAWSYQPLVDWVEFDCVYDDLSFTLEPGTHTLTLRNREGGFGFDVAAIAAIVVSSDPTTDPNTLFDPTP